MVQAGRALDPALSASAIDAAIASLPLWTEAVPNSASDAYTWEVERAVDKRVIRSQYLASEAEAAHALQAPAVAVAVAAAPVRYKVFLDGAQQGPFSLDEMALRIARGDVGAKHQGLEHAMESEGRQVEDRRRDRGTWRAVRPCHSRSRSRHTRPGLDQHELARPGDLPLHSRSLRAAPAAPGQLLPILRYRTARRRRQAVARAAPPVLMTAAPVAPWAVVSAAADIAAPAAPVPPPPAAPAPVQQAKGAPRPMSQPPKREPIRLRWWLVALASLWAIWLYARPSPNKIEARIEAGHAGQRRMPPERCAVGADRVAHDTCHPPAAGQPAGDHQCGISRLRQEEAARQSMGRDDGRG
ncbi:hypothetical protein LP420_27710 [Massilia sp. B-10]|nr:hypothetical protein LP420_27710 [Massilia sp. B-10]